MSRNPVKRIAFVKLTQQGKSYAMRCDRENLGIGDHVEVEMYAGTERAYWDDGTITAVEFRRWVCSCHVKNHVEEVSYSVDDSEGFALVRSVDLSRRSKMPIKQWREEKAPYFESLSASVRSGMRSIYEAISHRDGQDAYLGDGIWVRPDGSMNDRGR